jgi:hypothetical protein
MTMGGSARSRSASSRVRLSILRSRVELDIASDGMYRCPCQICSKRCLNQAPVVNLAFQTGALEVPLVGARALSLRSPCSRKLAR